ncbi:MAG TPA: hypothetical protein VLB73_02570 [Patescibacteria group bacterium]|nr:hypothetical protein [Patescibacteria group bacterium]
MGNEFIKNLLTVISSFSILIQSLSPIVAIVPTIAPATAYAQTVTPTDTVTPTPTDTVTPTDTIAPTPDTATPTPDNTTPTDTVTPTDTIAPTPSDTPTDAVTPTDNPTTSPSNTTNNPSQAPPATDTPTVTPSVTPDNTTTSVNGTLSTTILDNVAAPSLDLSTAPTSSATLTTNKADYAPTDTAVISGNSFAANTTYVLTISSTDNPTTSTTVNITTDANGSFTYAYQLDGNYRPNYSVVLKLSGTTVATTTFTDSPAVTTTQNNVACMADQPGQSGLNCTANDISVASVSSITINGHGCRFPGDTVSFTANWSIQSTANNRYNVGLWFNTTGGTSALHGTCSATSIPSSPAPFFDSGAGSVCGGLDKNPGAGTLSITQTATCNPDSSGFLKLPYCASWQQNSGACSVPTDTVPGSPSKCKCQDGFTIPITVPPSVEVVKSLSPANDSGLFNLQVNASSSATNVGNGGTTGKVGITTGAGNTFGETAGTATSLSNYTSTASCVLRGTATPVAITGTGPTWNITNVTNGQDIVCTITNTRSTGTIELKKVWSGTGGQTTLNIGTSAGGTQVASVQTGANGATPLTTGTKTVNAGTYFLSETGGLSNYTAALACTDNGNPATVTNSSVSVTAGHTVICTFTNTLQQAHLTLVKTLTKDNGGNAAITDWTLTATGNTNISGTSGNAAVTNAGVLPGTYALGESGGPSGYTAGTYSCVKNNGAPVSSNSITLANGDSATCTVNNNDNPPSLTLVKQVSNTHGGTAQTTDWTLTATGPTTLSGAGGATSGATFKAGTYTLSESTGSSGYTAGGWNCTNNVSVSNSQITLGLGQTTTCTIINSDVAPTLKLVKHVTNDNGGTKAPHDWTLVATGSGGFSDTGDSTTFHAVTAGVSYSLSESAISGYTAGNWSCDGGNQSTNTITLGVGQNVTCSVTNDDQAPSLTLVKHVSGGTALATAWTLTATGSSQSPTNLSGTTPVASGNTFKADTYTLGESGPSGYTASLYSCSKNNEAPVSGNSITLANGDSATCTVTNTRDQGSIELKKAWSGTAGQTTLQIGTSAGGTQVTHVQTGSNGTTPLTTGAQTVDTGTYYVSETGGLTDYAGVLTCTDNNSSVTPGQDSSVTVGKGDVVICTYTNTRNTGTIQVKKLVDPIDNSSWDFSVSGPTNNNAGPLASGLSSNQFISDTGSYTVSESAHTGTNGSNYTSTYSCSDGTTTVASGSGTTTSSFSLTTGENVLCTFTNSIKKGTIIVKKTMVGGTGSFDFTGDVAGTISTDGGILTTSNVLPGTYTSVEGAATGWDLTNISCDDPRSATTSTEDVSAATATFKVDPGETVTCTFTNTKKGHLIVQKTTNPSQDPTSFSILATGSGTITNGGNGTITDATDQNYEVTPGTYTVTETVPAGWQQDANACTNVAVGAGETVYCGITNTKLGNVTVIKFLDDNADGFKATAEATLNDWEIHLGQMSQFTGHGGNPVDGQVTFSDIYPGQYDLSEQLQSGYDQSNIYCANETGIDNNNSHAVTLGAGQNITCYIGNYQKAHITVVKQVVDPNGDPITDPSTNFNFSVTGQNPFTLTDDEQKSFDVKPGSYDVTETQNNNYDLGGCSAVYDNRSVGAPISQQNTQGENVTLGSSDTVTVTCVNKQKQGHVTGYKWSDGNGNANFDCDQETESCEPKLSGWTIFADTNDNQTLDQGEVSTTTDNNGNYTLDLNPGTYQICEVVQSGWKQTYPVNQTQSICWPVTIISNGTLEGNRNFGNQLQIPVLSITKTNDKLGADQHIGDSVLYTITLSATQAAAANVVLTDLLPKGFDYRNGSATIDTGSGAVPFSNFSDDYHSPGIWNIGNIAKDQTVTLTLIADINGTVSPGDYKDVAWAKGTPVSDSSHTVYATALNPGFIDTNFAGTDVNVVADTQSSTTLSPQQAVLGASTSILPETGANILWAETGVLLVLIGLGFTGYGILSRKKYGKNK